MIIQLIIALFDVYVLYFQAESSIRVMERGLEYRHVLLRSQLCVRWSGLMQESVNKSPVRRQGQLTMP